MEKIPEKPIVQNIKEPKKKSYFELHPMIGLAICAVCLIAMAVILYNTYYKTPKVDNSQSGHGFCVQVVTKAKNTATGEIKEFPNPCVIPAGWVVLDDSNTK